jgi:3-methyladenine DNA glycosylase AlkD
MAIIEGGERMDEQLVLTITAALEPHIDPAYRERVRDHFRMNVDRFLGVRTPMIRRVAADHYPLIRALPVDAQLDCCDALLATGTFEHKIIAFDWSYRCRRQFRLEHGARFARWLATHVNDWNDCDDLCTHTLGAFLLQFPATIDTVKTWTTSDNRWLRRGSAVSFIPAARKGQFLEHILDVADRLLRDEDDLVQKGYGWMLKEASEAHPEAVFAYVLRNRERMPRTALRYAIEKLPEPLRQQALAR